MADKKQKRLEIPVEVPQAPDMEAVEEKRPVGPLSTELPQAPDIEALTEEIRVTIPVEIPLSADKEIIREQPIVTIPLELPEARNVELKNVFIPFDGEWMPDSDPIEIGAKNYKTLQNYRYAGDKILHLESVLGYSKINTTALTTYTNIRNGYHLRTEYIPSLTAATIAFVDGGAGADTITDSSSRFVSRGFKIGMTITISGSTSNDGQQTIVGLAAGTLTLITDVLTTEGASATVTITGIAKSYVLVHAEHATAPSANASLVYQNQAGIPNQADFEATVLHTDSAVQLEGRFSDAPDSQVAYCNGKESCIWAGDEMRCAALLTSTAAITNALTNPRDYSDKIYNENINEVAEIGAAGSDTYTVLLLHMDGTDGAQVFTDSSPTTPHTMTAVNQTNTDTAQVKFGTASAGFDGTGDAITCPDNADFTLVGGGTPFTIDFQLMRLDFTGGDGEYAICGQSTDANNYWYIALEYAVATGYRLIFRGAKTDGTETVGCTSSWFTSTGWPAHHWIHCALVHTSDNEYILYAAGNRIGLYDSSNWTGWVDGTIVDMTGNFEIGVVSNPAAALDWYGWIDEFRVSKGVARWTSTTTYAVPERAYSASWESKYFVLGSTRPLQGIKFYLSNPNTEAATLTCQEWNGVSWTSLSITDNTSGLDNSNTVTWNTTVNSSKPKFLEGLFLYWYQFYMDAGSADIYHITVDAPFQEVVDIWDGVYRQVIQFQALRSSKYEDYTLEIQEKSFKDYPISATIGGLTSSDYVVLMFEERMCGLQWTLIAGLTNDTAATATVYYWTGAAWTAVTALADLTVDAVGSTKSMNQTGIMTWQPPDDNLEFKQTLFGMTGYTYKIAWSATLETGTNYNGTSVDTLFGVPAPIKIRPFKFSVKYKNRLMLCGFTEGKEGNRIDYSVTEAPDVFNGEESSMDGIQSLYVGGRDDLTGAIEIFNRFGSNIISSLLLFKKNETYLLTGDGPENYRIYTISKSIGCPAPLTLAAAETGYTFAEEINRNIVAWTSYAGPMIFDGAAILPIPGIKSYFDPAKTTRLETSVIERCRGWCDNTYKAYNLVIPSASGATNCNVWLAYDLVRKRWFEKEPGASEIPQAAWPVYDTDGVQYIYAGINDGNVMRLENGATWADTSATAMSPVIETGDFFPSGDLWDITSIRRVKTAVKLITEAAKNLQITWYKDSEASGTALGTTHKIDVGDPITKLTQGAASATPLRGWSHRFKFSLVNDSDVATGFATETQFHPVGWGYQYHIEHDDTRDV